MEWTSCIQVVYDFICSNQLFVYILSTYCLLFRGEGRLPLTNECVMMVMDAEWARHYHWNMRFVKVIFSDLGNWVCIPIRMGT